MLSKRYTKSLLFREQNERVLGILLWATFQFPMPTRQLLPDSSVSFFFLSLALCLGRARETSRCKIKPIWIGWWLTLEACIIYRTAVLLRGTREHNAWWRLEIYLTHWCHGNRCAHTPPTLLAGKAQSFGAFVTHTAFQIKIYLVASLTKYLLSLFMPIALAGVWAVNKHSPSLSVLCQFP